MTDNQEEKEGFKYFSKTFPDFFSGYRKLQRRRKSQPTTVTGLFYKSSCSHLEGTISLHDDIHFLDRESNAILKALHKTYGIG